MAPVRKKVGEFQVELDNGHCVKDAFGKKCRNLRLEENDRAQNAQNDTNKRFLNKLTITWVVPGPTLGKHLREWDSHCLPIVAEVIPTW